MNGSLRFILTLFVMVLSVTWVHGQEKTYSGTITSADDGQVIIGANVTVEGTTNGSSTGIDGKFSIKAKPGNKLIISYLGMKTMHVVAGSNTTINVTLESDAESIDEVVVIAFGSAKKKDLTGSISTVGSDLIAQQQTSSVSSALEGAVAGLQVSHVRGQPGEDANIIVRGQGSVLGGNNALVVVDGAPTDLPLSSINPADIESITISKDAASNALYGARGANGVVLVTTKKGRLGEAKVTFQGRWGINQQGVPEYDMIGANNPGEFYEYAWRSIYNNYRYKGSTDVINNPNMSHEEAAMLASQNLFKLHGTGKIQDVNELGGYMNYKLPIYPNNTTDKNDYRQYLIDPRTGKLNADAELLYRDDWNDFFIKDRFRQEYNVNISGANEKTDYYISLGYLSDPSFLVASQFERYTGRFNVNTQLKKWLRTGVNMSYAYRDTQFMTTSQSPGTTNANIFAFKALFPPIWNLYARDLDGNIRLNPDGSTMFDMGTGQTLSPMVPLTADGQPGGATRDTFKNYSPAIYITKDRQQTIAHDVIARGYLEASFLRDFKFKVDLAMDNVYSRVLGYENNESGSAAIAMQGSLGKTHQTTTAITSNQLLTWDKNFDKHHVDILAGHEYYWNYYDRLAASWKMLVVNNMPKPANTTTFNGASSDEGRGAGEGYILRASYNYASKYYLQLSGRREGTTKFANNPWGNFWAIGTSWRISGENWMQNARWVNDLKIRASIGTQGNKNLPGYPTLNTWTFKNTGTYDAPVLGIVQNAPGNPDLRWESSRNIDLGLDYRFFDRLYGAIVVYERRSSDMLWNVPMPRSTGLATRPENSASLRNRGIEIELGVDIINSPNTSWSVSLNGTHYKSILLDLPAGVGLDELGGKYVEGNYIRGNNMNYYTFYLLHYAGVDQTTGGPLFDRTLSKEDVASGGKWEGQKEGSIVQVNDGTLGTRYEMGTATPDFVGGFNTNFRWKQWDFSFITSFQAGGKFLSLTYSRLISQSLNRSAHVDMWDSWSPENQGSNIPMRMQAAPASWNIVNPGNIYTDYILFDASYFNIRSIMVGYNFSPRLARRLGMEGARVFANVDNLHLFTKMKGMDPRTTFDGGSTDGAFGFQQQRTLSLGINLTF